MPVSKKKASKKRKGGKTETGTELLRQAWNLEALGHRNEAIEQYSKAVAALENAVFQQHDYEHVPDLARAYVYRCNLLREAQRIDEATQAARSSLAIWTDLAESTSDAVWNVYIAEARVAFAICLQDTGRQEEAQTELKQAIALRSDGVDAASERMRVCHATALMQSGIIARSLQNPEAALAAYKQALAMVDGDFVKAPEAAPQRALILYNRANAMGDLEDFHAAQTAVRVARTIWIDLVGEVPKYREDIACAWKASGSFLMRLGCYEEAADDYKKAWQAFEIYDERSDHIHQRALLAAAWAVVLRRTAKTEVAASVLELSARLLERLPDSPLVEAVRAHVREQQTELQALASMATADVARWKAIATDAVETSHALRREGRNKHAIETLARAVEIYDYIVRVEPTPESHAERAFTHMCIIAPRMLGNHLQGAWIAGQQALASAEHALTHGGAGYLPLWGKVHYGLARIYRLGGDSEAALASTTRILEQRERSSLPEWIAVVDAAMGLEREIRSS